MDSEPASRSLASIAVGHGEALNPFGAIAPPIFQTSLFARGAVDQYTRLSNPTIRTLEHRVARLEGLPEGIAFASGMAAIAALVRVLSARGSIYLLGNGYAGTLRLLRAEAEAGNMTWVHVDRLEDLPGVVRSPGYVILESPANPFLQEYPLRELVKMLPSGVEVVVDNTFATPVLQRPAESGVQHVVHSASKYLAGHSDAIAGLVVTDSREIAEALRTHRTSHGACQDPFAAWLCLRGIQTLPLRMKQSSLNAHLVAETLRECPNVQDVFYPRSFGVGEQMSMGGAVVTFRVTREVDPDRFLDGLQMVIPAESLGGVESLVNQCACMSHSSLGEREASALGLDHRVFRLSCGIETGDEITKDILQAIDSAKE